MRMPFTDHHIQDKIIFRLVQGNARFSELVPEDMEHSLFMYHMKKLLKEGIVEKDDQIYRLTDEGAKLYNSRYRLAKPLRQPSLLIQFLVVQDGKVLLSHRTTSLQENLNQYMLPGGAHSFLSTSESSAKQIVKSRGLKLGAHYCTIETIARQRTFHGIIDIFLAEHVKDVAPNGSHELLWFPIEEVTVMNFEQAGSAPFVLNAYMSGNTEARLTNIVT